MVALRRIIVIFGSGRVIQVHASNNELEIMSPMKLSPDSQGKLTGFAYHYNYGDRFIYIMGGRNTLSNEKINKCAKFDVSSLKWHIMADMNRERYAPGTFISKDYKYLYAFGGE